MKLFFLTEEIMKDEYGKLIMWLGFILLLMLIDIITGWIQAYVNRDLKSGKMSTGILKKFALFLVLIGVVPTTILLPEIISASVIVCVYGLEIINEFTSIIENLNKLGIATKMFEPFMKRLSSTNQNTVEINKTNNELDHKEEETNE
ncbi:phage holin family protein [Enterococcus faecium]|uniref:phage holin family protein n=1 Tax=Enterococcus faecium TaxID=1352 RepID=UPI002157FDE0|nr:phage holin family protein [Enterococcus faecium]